MEMDIIATWLRAQLDLDEAHAQKDLWALDRASNGGEWEAHYGYNHPRSYLRAGEQEIGQLTVTVSGLPDGGEDQHAADAFLVSRLVRSARGRANHALAEVAAKKAIVSQFEAAGAALSVESIETLDLTLRHLASAYADRPGYQPEWAPLG